MARKTMDIAIMLLAAIFEVGGDAMIRAGLRQRGWVLMTIGVATLGAYGVVVNLLPMDFSKLLATYVAFFAIVSVLSGKFLFRESVPTTTWVGLVIILIGSAVVQYGSPNR